MKDSTQLEAAGRQLRSMTSAWTSDLNPDAPWPEYPRPQLQRTAWLNLNGTWEFAGGKDFNPNPNLPFPEKIVVPYPVQSKLSGICRQGSESKHMWYRRGFTIPNAWDGQRILIHFGAVDWQAAVWINSVRVGVHCGGYDRFTFDITSALQNGSSGSVHELLVEVTDPSGACHAHPASGPDA